ncbi:MAG: phosphoglycerate mutase family protein [Defluviitaleaceae bacterium]|nr:phosphoglycerate mutase family protein [Defluviitaleaceae bacterium]
MKMVYMRHSEPAYPNFEEMGLIGFGRDLASLTPKGIEIADKAAKNPMLDGADIIVSSPLTRALQTAGIIARHTDLPLEVELGFIERRVDLSQKLNHAERESLYKDYELLCHMVN